MTRSAVRELLLIALRTGDDGARAQQLAGATAEDWQGILRCASLHGTKALLYRQLKATGVQVPEEILQGLREGYLQGVLRNMRLFHELYGVLDLFHHEDVPVILLKGAYLAERVYGDIAVRPMVDMDILVKEQDLGRVRDILSNLGFAQRGLLDEAIREAHHFVYKHPGHGLCVEVHWDLIDKLYGVHVDIEGLWGRAQPTTLRGVPLLVMTPEDTLLHLCVHASVHVFQYGLRMVCDIAEMVWRGGIDWERVGQRAYLWKAERCVYVNLWLARGLLNAPVPEGWLDSIKPRDLDRRYLLLAEEHLFMSVEEPERALTAQLVKMWMEKGVAGKFVRLWRRLFPSRQVMAVMYPASPNSFRLLLYYPVRLKDVLQRHGRVAWHLLRGNEQMVLRAERQNQTTILRDWLLSG